MIDQFRLPDYLDIIEFHMTIQGRRLGGTQLVDKSTPYEGYIVAVDKMAEEVKARIREEFSDAR